MSLIMFPGKKCFNKVTKVYFGCFFVKLTVVSAQSCHNKETICPTATKNVWHLQYTYGTSCSQG